MENKSEEFSPLYNAYSKNSKLIDAAIEMAVRESALAMGKAFGEVFSIRFHSLEVRKSA